MSKRRAPLSARARAAAKPSPERSAALRSAQVRKRQDKFLAVYASVCTIAGACRALARNKKKNEFTISRECVRLWRRDDEAFEQRFQDTKVDLTAVMAEATYDDALGEWDEKLQRYFGGNPLLKMFVMKKLDPSYRDQMKLEHAGAIKTSPEIAAIAAMSKAELLKLAGIKE